MEVIAYLGYQAITCKLSWCSSELNPGFVDANTTRKDFVAEDILSRKQKL